MEFNEWLEKIDTLDENELKIVEKEVAYRRETLKKIHRLTLHEQAQKTNNKYLEYLGLAMLHANYGDAYKPDNFDEFLNYLLHTRIPKQVIGSKLLLDIFKEFNLVEYIKQHREN